MAGIIAGMGFLTVGSIYDIRSRRIPWPLVIAGGIAAVVLTVYGAVTAGVAALTSALCGLIPGAIFIALSIITKGKVGIGDGIALGIVGSITGLSQALVIAGLGLFLQSLAAVVLLVIRRVDGQSRLPFLPFMLAGWIVAIVLEVRF